MNDLSFENIDIDSEQQNSYDLLFASMGFESRALAIPKKLLNKAKCITAIGFDQNRDIAYLSNKDWFESHADNIFADVSDLQFVEIVREQLQQVIEHKNPQQKTTRIAFDVSCLNRFRIASAIAETNAFIVEGRIIVDFLYALAEFQPPQSTASPNEFLGPVHSNFSGLFRDPERPVALVAGLGYEHGKVVGATEYIQASRVVTFFPKSDISEYEQHVRRANRSILEEIDPRDIIHYPLNNPVKALAMLDSAIRGLEETYNVVILPLGPKLFSVFALITHLFHSESSVWRVSSGRHSKPRDVNASGHFLGIGIRTEFRFNQGD